MKRSNQPIDIPSSSRSVVVSRQELVSRVTVWCEDLATGETFARKGTCTRKASSYRSDLKVKRSLGERDYTGLVC